MRLSRLGAGCLRCQYFQQLLGKEQQSVSEQTFPGCLNSKSPLACKLAAPHATCSACPATLADPIDATEPVERAQQGSFVSSRHALKAARLLAHVMAAQQLPEELLAQFVELEPDLTAAVQASCKLCTHFGGARAACRAVGLLGQFVFEVQPDSGSCPSRQHVGGVFDGLSVLVPCVVAAGCAAGCHCVAAALLSWLWHCQACALLRHCAST